MLFRSGLVRTRGDDKHLLISAKAASQSELHPSRVSFFNSLKSGRAFSADFGRKRVRAASQPVSCCTSFLVLGGCMSSIALHLSGFASIPLLVNMKPRNLPAGTPKAHFDGFSLI